MSQNELEVTFERSKKITSDLCQLHYVSIGIPLEGIDKTALLNRIKGYSLYDMICANRKIAAHQKELIKNQKPGESISLQTFLSPRLIAAVYVFFNYPSSRADDAEPIFSIGSKALCKVNI